jgi:hypothetical protein
LSADDFFVVLMITPFEARDPYIALRRRLSEWSCFNIIGINKAQEVAGISAIRLFERYTSSRSTDRYLHLAKRRTNGIELPADGEPLFDMI